MNADAPKRKNLGRGLNALFGDLEAGDAAPAPTQPSAVSGATQLPLDLLSPSPFQPRRRFAESALDELAASIAEKGVLQPLLVRSSPSEPGRYQIVAGERRWRAAQRANVHEVPVHITELSDAEVLEVALIENLQREDLSPVEEAAGYQRLLEEFQHTQERLAEIVGKSRAHVANSLRLLALPHTVLAMLDRGEISAGQARPLIGSPHAETLAKLIIKRGLNARQSERLAKGYGCRRASARVMKDPDTVALEQSLEKATGYKVKVSFDGKGGVISISYSSLEQLDDIVRRLSTNKPPKIAAEQVLDSDESFPLDDAVTASDDHTKPYLDPAADDVGSSGSTERTPHE